MFVAQRYIFFRKQLKATAAKAKKVIIYAVELH
jgi:hypothetical protein